MIVTCQHALYGDGNGLSKHMRCEVATLASLLYLVFSLSFHYPPIGLCDDYVMFLNL